MPAYPGTDVEMDADFPVEQKPGDFMFVADDSINFYSLPSSSGPIFELLTDVTDGGGVSFG